jgi:outer membrane biosynthesis protein TonB
VELVSKQDDRQREQRLEVRLPRRGDDGASRAGGSQSRRVSGGEKPFRLQDEADALKKPLHVAVDDEVLARTLKAVRRGIRPYWQDAEPPGMGKVALRMEIDGSGSIVSMWITKLQGPPKLGEFVASLVRRAAPFPGAGHGLPNPLVIDCAFNVTGRSANTAQ